MKKILETERLYLREFTMDDAQILLELNSDPRVTRYTEKGGMKTIGDAEDRLRNDILVQYKNHGIGRWAVFLKKNNEFIGWCGIKYSSSDKAVTLGYRFFHKHWGKGYATESAKACLDYGRDVLKINTIIAKAMSLNTASIHVIKKLGMTYVRNEVCAEHPAEVYQVTKVMV
jgi:RimJ/RimL family protein N-acetyltransferase